MYRRYQNRADWRGPESALTSAMARQSIDGAGAKQAVSPESEFAGAVLSCNSHKAGHTHEPPQQVANKTGNSTGAVWEGEMTHSWLALAVLGAGLVLAATASPAIAQKRGGILKSYSIDSPASM